MFLNCFSMRAVTGSTDQSAKMYILPLAFVCLTLTPARAGQEVATCTWDKALVKGASRCTLVFVG